MSDYIPEDVLANILLRLPFDSLLRSRCVSKSWRALIDSPNFTTMHLERSLKTNSPDNVQIIALNQNTFYNFNFESEGSFLTKAKQINYPVEYSSDRGVHLVGSCNGLLCLMNPNNNIVLWNPWIQKYWEFPSPDIDESIRADTMFSLGFGYDQVHDDYKVLNLVTVLTDFLSREVSSLYQDDIYIYSLKLNSWRRIEDLPHRLSLGSYGDGPFANGALHWIVEENVQKYSIIAFDLSSEKFRKMACPMFIEDSFSRDLKIMNGCLCLLTYDYYHLNGIDLWLMEDYAVEKSWTKLTTLKLGGNFWTLWPLTPLVYSKNNRQILLQIEREKLIRYDLETKSMTDVAISTIDVAISSAINCLTSCVCVGTLFWPLHLGGTR